MDTRLPCLLLQSLVEVGSTPRGTHESYESRVDREGTREIITWHGRTGIPPYRGMGLTLIVSPRDGATGALIINASSQHTNGFGYVI
jgi:hypothetical protein